MNLQTERGREILRELAQGADVFVENFRVGTTDEWEISYQMLASENSDLVYCSLSGYGEWGPYAKRPAYDQIIQAESGLMSITSPADGESVRVGIAIANIGAGMYATQAILAALFRREFGDASGQKIDVSLFDGQLAWLSYMASYYFATGNPPGKMGSRHPTIVPYQAFPIQDGDVVVAAASEKIWRNFCHALDRPDLLEDDRFGCNADRVANRNVLESTLEETTAAYETDETVALLEAADVPVTSVHDIVDAFDTPTNGPAG